MNSKPQVLHHKLNYSVIHKQITINLFLFHKIFYQHDQKFHGRLTLEYLLQKRLAYLAHLVVASALGIVALYDGYDDGILSGELPEAAFSALLYVGVLYVIAHCLSVFSVLQCL